MSIESYDRKVSKGIAGEKKPVCFVAAIEQLVPQSLPANVYKEYEQFINWYSPMRREKREQENDAMEDIFNKVFRTIGGLTCQDVYWKRVHTARGLTTVVNRLMREDYSVTVDVNDRNMCHTIGLLPLPDGKHYALTGNHIPPKLPPIATLQDIAPHLMINGDRHMTRFPFNDSNVLGIPPVD